MDLSTFRWQDHPGNPLVEPESPKWLVADPSVLLSHETPDGLWRLYANTIPPRLVEYVSRDGVSWRKSRELFKGALRPFVRRFGARWWLFYERVTRWLPLRSHIECRYSNDLENWSQPARVLEPNLGWHGRRARTCSNPSVVRWGGEWRLFYSAGVVWLPDCKFFEPRFIGVARSDRLGGPWRPDLEPLISPDPHDPQRNLGAGAIRALPDPGGGPQWALTNGIFRDAAKRSRSAISIVRLSPDARRWQAHGDEPVLGPEPGWKAALVYAMDLRFREGPQGREGWLYYNARDGWFRGRESIGLACGVPGKSARDGLSRGNFEKPTRKGESSAATLDLDGGREASMERQGSGKRTPGRQP